MRCLFAICLNTGLTLGLMGFGAPIWIGIVTAFPVAWLASRK